LAAAGAAGPAAAVGLVDLGATKTGVAVASAQGLCFVRTVLWGGQTLTRALAEGLGLPEPEAEALKRELSLLEPGEERGRAAQPVLLRAVEALVAELHKTLVAYRQTGGPEVERLLLVGGGARLAGLDALLQRALELPVAVARPADLPGVTLPPAAAGLGPEIMPALGLALGALGRLPRSRLNFRQGAFAHRRELAGLRRQAAVAAGLAAATGLLLLADAYADYAAKARRFAALEAQVRQAYRELFPQGPLPANEALALRAQTEALKKELAQIGGLAGSRLTPLDLLAELSQRVPRDVRIDVQEFVVERDQVRLRAETDSFESVDRIKAELLKFDQVKDIQVSDARVNAAQTAVGFRFTIALAREV
ncbi:MAG TPA: cell division protein FtsA, partial [Thermodesulfobacteriota bacterium]|nr:cell division protein FtsA [Thermodesulfobacteriota bacterium]